MEHVPGESPETEAHRALEALPEVLGYHESLELAELRREIVEADAAGEDVVERMRQYLQAAEQITDEADNPSASRLGMLIRTALLRRDRGRYDDFLADLEEALIMAQQEGFEDVALVLNELLNMS